MDDFDLSNIDIPEAVTAQGYGSVAYRGNKPIPTFEWKAVELKSQTELEGRPIFEQRLFCSQRVRGSKDQPGDVEVKFIISPSSGKKVPDPRNLMVRRYPVELKRFLENGERPADGTPLEQWPRMTPDRIAVCHWLEIRTIEDLASLKDNDMAIQKLGMGGRELVAQANAFLNVRSDSSFAERLAAEKEAMARDFAAKFEQQQQQLEALSKKLDAVSSAGKGKDK